MKYTITTLLLVCMICAYTFKITSDTTKRVREIWIYPQSCYLIDISGRHATQIPCDWNKTFIKGQYHYSTRWIPATRLESPFAIQMIREEK